MTNELAEMKARAALARARYEQVRNFVRGAWPIPRPRRIRTRALHTTMLYQASVWLPSDPAVQWHNLERLVPHDRAMR